MGVSSESVSPVLRGSRQEGKGQRRRESWEVRPEGSSLDPALGAHEGPVPLRACDAVCINEGAGRCVQEGDYDRTAALTFTLYPGLGQTLPKHDLLRAIRTVYQPLPHDTGRKQGPGSLGVRFPELLRDGTWVCLQCPYSVPRATLVSWVAMSKIPGQGGGLFTPAQHLLSTCSVFCGFITIQRGWCGGGGGCGGEALRSAEGKGRMGQRDHSPPFPPPPRASQVVPALGRFPRLDEGSRPLVPSSPRLH